MLSVISHTPSHERTDTGRFARGNPQQHDEKKKKKKEPRRNECNKHGEEIGNTKTKPNQRNKTEVREAVILNILHSYTTATGYCTSGI